MITVLTCCHLFYPSQGCFLLKWPWRPIFCSLKFSNNFGLYWSTVKSYTSSNKDRGTAIQYSLLTFGLVSLWFLKNYWKCAFLQLNKSSQEMMTSKHYQSWCFVANGLPSSFFIILFEKKAFWVSYWIKRKIESCN